MSAGRQKKTFKIFDTSDAVMFTGTGNQDRETGRELTLWSRAGNCETHWKNGAHTRVTTGPDTEVVHTQPVDASQEEDTGKLIIARHGDITLIAETGNIKLKGKNLIFEAEGSGQDGEVSILGNGLMTLSSNETVRISGGEVQITAEKNIVLNPNGFIYLIGDLKSGGAPSAVGLVQAFMNGGWGAALSGVAKGIRGLV